VWITIWRFHFYIWSVWENDANDLGDVWCQTVADSGQITNILSSYRRNPAQYDPGHLFLLNKFKATKQKQNNNVIYFKTVFMPQVFILYGIVNTKMPCWLLALTNRKVAHDLRQFICSLCRRFLSSNFISDDHFLFLGIIL